MNTNTHKSSIENRPSAIGNLLRTETTRKGKTDRTEAIQLFAKTLVTVFLCEAGIMALLHVLGPKRQWGVILDPALLTVLSTPILYGLLVRPIWSSLRQRTRAVEDLRQYRERLEELVLARTTELTETNTQLRAEIKRRRALEGELLSVVERERQRTGRELHDGIGQQLTGIAFMVEALGRKLSEKSLSEEASYAEKINTRIHHASQQTHTLVKGLQPIDLERSGLAFALQELADDTQQLFNVSCRFTCEEPVGAPGITVATNLYRIAQEAITNAIKHGKARRITIALASGEEALTLRVDNDGLAFPAGQVAGKGMGLSIMHYRAEMIEGSLEIQQGPDGGTSVTCVVSNKTHA